MFVWFFFWFILHFPHLFVHFPINQTEPNPTTNHETTLNHPKQPKTNSKKIKIKNKNREGERERVRNVDLAKEETKNGERAEKDDEDIGDEGENRGIPISTVVVD